MKARIALVVALVWVAYRAQQDLSPLVVWAPAGPEVEALYRPPVSLPEWLIDRVPGGRSAVTADPTALVVLLGDPDDTSALAVLDWFCRHPDAAVVDRALAGSGRMAALGVRLIRCTFSAEEAGRRLRGLGEREVPVVLSAALELAELGEPGADLLLADWERRLGDTAEARVVEEARRRLRLAGRGAE